MNIKYDIKKMSLLQFIEFFGISIIYVPVELILALFIFVGSKVFEIREIFKNYVQDLCEKCKFPLKN